jgi:Domain of unknown function (DUF4411)
VSYLLDANVFISAKNLHYGLDFCPAFWEWLVHQGNIGKVFSIDKVADEIAAGADDLAQWAKNQGSQMFRTTSPPVIAEFGKVSTWVTGQQYEPAAINTFLQVADFFLIAHAIAGKHIVVTHEVAANSTKRIKIPNVCLGLDVRFITPYQMLRIEQARFVLGKQA